MELNIYIYTKFCESLIIYNRVAEPKNTSTILTPVSTNLELAGQLQNKRPLNSLWNECMRMNVETRES